MQIVTGYYAKLSWYQTQPFFAGFLPLAVSAMVPKGWRYAAYQSVAPSWDILREWKATNDTERYTRRYKEEILGRLDPITVQNDLERFGDKLCLLCFEKSGTFCHRHLLGEWLQTNLGIVVQECPLL